MTRSQLSHRDAAAAPKLITRKVMIPVVAPFRLDFTVWALKRRLENHIDQWQDGTYLRVLVIDDLPVGVIIRQQGTIIHPKLDVTFISCKPLGEVQEQQVLHALQRMLGAQVDLRPFYSLIAKSKMLQGLAKEFRGVKPPRFPDLFEALVNAISCQQLSLTVGMTLMTRFAEKFGKGFADGHAMRHAFPRPEDLTHSEEADIRMLGYSANKAKAILEIAKVLHEQPMAFARLETMDNEEVVDFLMSLRGIGRWSAQYVLLRGLGRLNIFPGDDVGAQNNLQKLFHLKTKPGYDTIDRLTSRWQPYRGMIYFHLLLQKLRQAGVL